MPTNRSTSESGERRTATAQPTPTVAPDFGSFMRQVFPDTPGFPGADVLSDAPGFPELRSAEDAVRGSLAPVAPPPLDPWMHRDYDAALVLLDRASDALPALVRHCQQLEIELQHVRAEAAADVEAAHGETQQWQQIAVALKMHIEESEHQLSLLRKRLAVAEERLTAGQTIVAAAEQQANFAMEITTLFHDKIVDAFGAGSPVHAALDGAGAGGPRPPHGPDGSGR